MDFDNVVMFCCFMVGLLTTSVAAGLIVMNNPNLTSTIIIWGSMVFFIANAGSWYILGVKLTQLEQEEK